LDAAYTPTDYVMKYLIHNSDCRWLSATNGDNIYGSGVVESVRNLVKEYEEKNALLKVPPAGSLTTTGTDSHHLLARNSNYKLPDMILTPLDTRNFPNDGKKHFVVSPFASDSLSFLVVVLFHIVVACFVVMLSYNLCCSCLSFCLSVYLYHHSSLESRFHNSKN
jgi:hypothetical protein